MLELPLEKNRDEIDGDVLWRNWHIHCVLLLLLRVLKVLEKPGQPDLLEKLMYLGGYIRMQEMCVQYDSVMEM